MPGTSTPKFLDELKKILQEDNRFVKDRQLLKNAIVEHALKLDKDLVELLLSNKRAKQHFFIAVDGVLVFDKDEFVRFVNNKDFLPDSYTSFKNRIGLISDGNGDYLRESKDVVLVWPYKDCVLEGGQTKEDQKRDEIFWNETLAPDEIDRLFVPKVLTNFKQFDKKGEHKVSEVKDTDNLIIKGNNLLALHSLKKKLAGQVKLIYIDPPYNREDGSFQYNDNFKHSTWLTFMKNRLELALKLLSNDGLIMVQCSFHEHAYLNVLMDNLFDRDNHLCTFNTLVRHPERILTGDKEFNDVIEYTLVYRKHKSKKMPKIKEAKEVDEYIYEIKELKKGKKIKVGDKEVTVFKPGEYEINKGDADASKLKPVSIRGSIREKNSSGRFYVKYLEGIRNKYPPYTIFKAPLIGDDIYPHRYFYTPKKNRNNGGYFQGMPVSSEVTIKPYPNFLDYHQQYNNVAKEGGVQFRNGKKPEDYLKFFIKIATDEGDLIIDFFAGSGTTAAVAHKMKRQYIAIEQMDYIDNITVKRLRNVISGEQSGISKSVQWKEGGDFIYCDLMKWNEVYIEKIQKAKTKNDLAKIWKALREKAHLSYKVDFNSFDESAKEYEQLNIEDQKRFLLEVLDKNQIYVNYSEIDDADYNVSEEDKRLNKLFYKE